jgi:hypothetical protein
MKAKHMDVACYSILLVAVAIVGIQLTSPESVSGQEEEEEEFITSIAQDGQNANDGTQLTAPASVSGQEQKESTTTSLAQDDQNIQGGPAVFPRIASVTDKSEVGADVTDSRQVSKGDDSDAARETGADSSNDPVDSDGADGGAGLDGADGGAGLDGADGIGRDGADGTTESANGVEGVDSFAIQLEASIP